MKQAISDLAALGGPQSFVQPLHVGRPNIGGREAFLRRVNQMFDDRWLTNNGPFVKEFEQALAEYLEVKHCVAMCNATIALEIATRSGNLHGEVIVPSFTFIATAHVLRWQKITPIFCDIDPATHCLNPNKVEQLITPRTTGIIGVHVWGRSCNVEALAEIARRRGLTLMFDAAHAFGCSHAGRMIGGFGLAEVFSFHATKFFNTFEGGAVVTNDDALAQKMRLMRNFGFSGDDSVVQLGTNGKMSEVSAAMGLTGLENLDEFMAANRRNYQAYKARLDGVPGISLIRYDETGRRNFHYVVAEVDAARAGVHRDVVMEVLRAENVLARRYFWPGCHRMEPYRSDFPHAGLLLPETEKVASRVLVLPTGTAISPEQIETICQVIRLAIEHGPDLTARLELRA